MSAASDRAAVGTTLEDRYSLTVAPQRGHSCRTPGRAGSTSWTRPQAWQQTMSSRGPISALYLQTAFPRICRHLPNGGPDGLRLVLLAGHPGPRRVRPPGARVLGHALPGRGARPRRHEEDVLAHGARG